MLKQAEVKLDRQNPPDRLVQQPFRQLPLPDKTRQLGKRPAHRDFGVASAFQGVQPRLLIRADDLVGRVEPRDPAAVGGEHPFKPHRLPQQLPGDFGVGRHRDAVYLRIGGHHPGDAGLLVRRLKGGREGFVQLPVADPFGGAVEPRLALGVAEEVLGDAADPVPLHPPHIVDAHLGDKIRVLPEGLIGPAPAGVPGNVDDRAHRRIDADRPAFRADDIGHRLQQFRVPGRAHIQHRGEDRPAGPGVAAEVFRLESHRDAEAGLLDKVPLDGVGDPGNHHRVGDAGQGKLGEPPVPVREVLPQGVKVYLPVFHKRDREVAAELGGLFFQRHPPQQVVHPVGYREGWVFVAFHRMLLSL